MKPVLKRIISEPFVQFLFLGLLLFIFVSIIQQRNDKSSREIIIDNERIGQMIVNYKSQTGVLPNKAQLDGIIENYIQEEISYREAKKMGLDRDDEIVRRRLSQKFNFVQTDLDIVKSPDEKELLSFYQNNQDLFREPARISFSHIYFSIDHATDSIARQRALTVLIELNHSGLTRAPAKGDRFPLQYDYTEQTELDIKQNFGDRPFAADLFKGPVGQWAGPIQSGYGWHLFYVFKKDPAVLPSFSAVKDQVRSQYMEHEKAAQDKAVFDKLEKKYIIKRIYLDSE